MAWYRCVGGAGGSLKLRTASGRIATFNTNMVEPFKSLKSDINPVQDLHGYSKPWSGGGGKNKINVADKTQQSSGYLFSNYAIVLPSGNWTLSFDSTATSGQCNFIIKNGSTDIANKTVNLTNGRVSLSVTTTQSSTRIECYINTGGTFSKIMLENNATATAYEPYSNICPISGFPALNVTLADGDMQTVDTATVNFGQTVYGGVADVTNGKVTVTQIAHVFDGSENFLTLASGRVFAYDFGVNVVYSFNNNNSLCSHFHEGYGAWDLLGVGEYLVGGGRYGGVNPDMTLANYKTYLQAQYSNGTPVTLVATLATPIEITTTPENLTAISGENNVYGDTNGDTEVKYLYRE